MNDTCGPMWPTPFASYDRQSRSWRTSEVTCLWALTLYSLTLPQWGCLHGGELFELPTPERLISESEYSSLLKTPHAGLGERGRDGVYPNPNGQYDLQHQMADLLPTPSAQNGEDRNQAIWERPADQPQNLENALALLPMPTVNDIGAGKDPEWWDEWAARQMSSDGRPAPHGRSLEQESIRLPLLGTPRSQMGSMSAKPRERLETDIGQLLGASTAPPSTAGSASPDPHQFQLFSA